jgi:hypothetical protein
VEDANVKIFQAASIISIVGIALLGCSVGFLEVSTLRTISVIIALFSMGLPFALRFIVDKHKKIGVIRFSELEILTKLHGGDPIIHDVSKIEQFEFNIIDFEGETKARDLIRTSSTMNVRSGADNQVLWKINNEEHHHQFKLESELQKRKILYFLKSIEKQVEK